MDTPSRWYDLFEAYLRNLYNWRERDARLTFSIDDIYLNLYDVYASPDSTASSGTFTRRRHPTKSLARHTQLRTKDIVNSDTSTT